LGGRKNARSQATEHDKKGRKKKKGPLCFSLKDAGGGEGRKKGGGGEGGAGLVRSDRQMEMKLGGRKEKNG